MTKESHLSKPEGCFPRLVVLTSHVGLLLQWFEGIQVGMQPKNGFIPTFRLKSSVICPQFEPREPANTSPLVVHSLHPSFSPTYGYSRVLWRCVHLSAKPSQPQQGPQHRAIPFALSLLMRWKQSVPHLHYSPFFSQFAGRACGTSAPQLPAPEFGPSFLILPKSRWVLSLTWKRKIIPTHPVSMAAGISLKC